MERTEEDKILQSGIKVILGGQEYEIRPLVIRESREWRKKVVEALAGLPSYVNVTTEDAEGFGKALGAMLVDMPNQVIDLFFDYAKELNEEREEIEDKATDAEMAKAFEEVIKVAFPLASSLVGTVGNLSQ